MKIYTNTCSHRESVLAAALGLLAGDELVPVHGHRRLALPPVSRLLLKLLPQPEESFVLPDSKYPRREFIIVNGPV